MIAHPPSNAAVASSKAEAVRAMVDAFHRRAAEVKRAQAEPDGRDAPAFALDPHRTTV
jgi:hypothetical protein